MGKIEDLLRQAVDYRLGLNYTIPAHRTAIEDKFILTVNVIREELKKRGVKLTGRNIFLGIGEHGACERLYCRRDLPADSPFDVWIARAEEKLVGLRAGKPPEAFRRRRFASRSAANPAEAPMTTVELARRLLKAQMSILRPILEARLLHPERSPGDEDTEKHIALARAIISLYPELDEDEPRGS